MGEETSLGMESWKIGRVEDREYGVAYRFPVLPPSHRDPGGLSGFAVFIFSMCPEKGNVCGEIEGFWELHRSTRPTEPFSFRQGSGLQTPPTKWGSDISMALPTPHLT